MNDFVIHSCEQVLRFSSVADWNKLPEERKVQLSFNMGVMSHGLGLTKEDGYDFIAGACSEKIAVKELHEHVRNIVESKEVPVKEENVNREV